jgi:hypothetical protein
MGSGCPTINKLQCIAVCNPYKPLAKTHVMAFVDGYVSSKCFAQMRVETFFIAARPATTKCNWVEQSGQVLCHEVE